MAICQAEPYPESGLQPCATVGVGPQRSGYLMTVFNLMTNYTTLGGRIECTQCNAMSKRSRQRCQAPAIKGKTKCRFHGGKSTGAKTAEGRARIAAAHTVHGRETRAIRAERSAKLAELYELEMLGRSIGMFEGRMVGRKPLGYPTHTKQWDELRKLDVDDRREAIRKKLRSNITGN